MSSKTVSVHLHPANLIWLKSQARASGRRNLSEILNEVLDQLRTRGRGAEVRSVKGTIRLPDSVADLEEATQSVRDMFRRSVERSAESLVEADGADR